MAAEDQHYQDHRAGRGSGVHREGVEISNHRRLAANLFRQLGKPDERVSIPAAHDPGQRQALVEWRGQRERRQPGVGAVSRGRLPEVETRRERSSAGAEHRLPHVSPSDLRRLFPFARIVRPARTLMIPANTAET